MSRFTSLGFFAAFFAVLVLTPFWGDQYLMRLAITIAMYSALALSWNFIGGFTGYPSFSAAAFFGLGAYVGAILQNHETPMAFAWIGATIFVGAFAAALGAIILRLKGHYFAIGSIAVVEVVRLVISSMSDLTGGGDGLNVPLIAGGPAFVSMVILYIMSGIVLLVFAVTWYVDHSRFGFGLRCIQQNEDAANMVGVHTTYYKIIAYTLSACFSGTVGAVYATWVGYIDPTDSFNILMTVKVPVMALLGGAGTVLGPVVGATVFILLEELFWANFLDWNRAILGIVIVVLVFFLPGGLLKLDYRRIYRRVLGSRQRPELST